MTLFHSFFNNINFNIADRNEYWLSGNLAGTFGMIKSTFTCLCSILDLHFELSHFYIQECFYNMLLSVITWSHFIVILTENFHVLCHGPRIFIRFGSKSQTLFITRVIAVWPFLTLLDSVFLLISYLTFICLSVNFPYNVVSSKITGRVILNMIGLFLWRSGCVSTNWIWSTVNMT